jgi:hypothetical protein
MLKSGNTPHILVDETAKIAQFLGFLLAPPFRALLRNPVGNFA